MTGEPLIFDAALPPAERPLAAIPGRGLRSCLASAIATGAGACGAHCIHELWMRGEYPDRIETALTQLWASAAATIPEWLPMRYLPDLKVVYEVAGRFTAPPGRTNIYLVLLDYRDRRRGPFGFYVGMSRYAPAERFDQHKTGIRAAGSVLKRGLEVLTGPTLHLQRIARPAAARIERELAAALEDAGLMICGGH